MLCLYTPLSNLITPTDITLEPSKVILGRLGPISFHWLNRQESAEILRKQKFRILTSLNLDNFHFFWIIELRKFQNLSKSHQCLQEHFNHHMSSSETNASCSHTTTIPCHCWNNIMVCIYSSLRPFWHISHTLKSPVCMHLADSHCAVDNQFSTGEPIQGLPCYHADHTCVSTS